MLSPLISGACRRHPPPYLPPFVILKVASNIENLGFGPRWLRDYWIPTQFGVIPPTPLTLSPHRPAYSPELDGKGALTPPRKMCLETFLPDSISLPTLGEQARWPPSGEGLRRLSFGVSGTEPNPKGGVAFLLHILSGKDGEPLTRRGDSRVGAPVLGRSCSRGRRAKARSIPALRRLH